MPYGNCSGCGVTVYSAARWSTHEECPACGHPLGRPIPVGTLRNALRSIQEDFRERNGLGWLREEAPDSVSRQEVS